jgi:hypothetical protein
MRFLNAIFLKTRVTRHFFVLAIICGVYILYSYEDLLFGVREEDLRSYVLSKRTVLKKSWSICLVLTELDSLPCLSLID